MAGKAVYAERLRGLRDWRPFLVTHSGLPGPRGNIELGQAVADLGTPRLFRVYLAVDAESATPDHEKEYLVFPPTPKPEAPILLHPPASLLKSSPEGEGVTPRRGP
jgi:hypothetical protein